MSFDQTIWTARPSQWVNLKSFTLAIGLLVAFCVLNASGAIDSIFHPFPFLVGFKGLLKTVLFLLPVVFALCRWLEVRFHIYELTEEVFREHYGILNRVSKELELYRVNDTMIVKPFDLNILGLGNVILHTSDASDPYVIIRAIENSDTIRATIRHHVEQQRNRKGIVEIGNR